MPKIYRVYIWQKLVRPKEEKVDYSYDFRNKTLAWVQSDWRSFPEWTDWVAFDSNWMYKSGHGYKKCVYNFGREIATNAKKITLTNHQNKWYYDIDCALWMWILNWSTFTNITFIYFWYYSGEFWLNWTSKWTTSSTLSNWYYTQTIVVDFQAATITFSGWNTTQTFSLSSSDITALRSITSIYCGTCKNQSNYIPDISIKVE